MGFIKPRCLHLDMPRGHRSNEASAIKREEMTTQLRREASTSEPSKRRDDNTASTRSHDMSHQRRRDNNKPRRGATSHQRRRDANRPRRGATRQHQKLRLHHCLLLLHQLPTVQCILLPQLLVWQLLSLPGNNSQHLPASCHVLCFRILSSLGSTTQCPTSSSWIGRSHSCATSLRTTMATS